MLQFMTNQKNKMDISFLIVTKNRPQDLVVTLSKLHAIIDVSKHEVLVFIDGCIKTETLIPIFNWVNWSFSKESISASPARNALYKNANGTIFIGLDDDAHPISSDFIASVESEFAKNAQLGILAFQEVKGIFKTDEEALAKAKQTESFFTNEFIGCGFAILKKVYKATNGFPIWMDIYGEESALSLEVLNINYTIKFTPQICVNHRVDSAKRMLQKRNYFRFEKQLQNTIRYYLVYFPNPSIKIAKLLFHNFRKYALNDIKCFRLFWNIVFNAIFNFFRILKYRKPVSKKTIQKLFEVKGLQF